MIPLHMTLRGAIGIKAGLNREELVLDLDVIPYDAVTVALRGDNGTGKSTILNLGLTPWREPPQIQGSVYDHFGEEGLRELIWSHGDETYRSRIEIRQSGKTRSQKAFLHERRNATEWHPVSLPDLTMSDGKTSTYDQCLESILGPRDIYFLSAFRAQGAASLAEYDDPKALMRALLNLDDTFALSDKAKDVARGLRGHYDAGKAALSQYSSFPERITELQRFVAEIDEAMPEQAANRDAGITWLSRGKAELDLAMRDELEDQRLLDKVAKLRGDLDAAEREARGHADGYASSINSAEARMGSETARHNADAARLLHDKKRELNRKRRADELLSRADAIEAAAVKAEKLQRELDDECLCVDDLQEKVRSISEIETQVAALTERQKAIVAEGHSLKAQHASLEQRAGYIEIVPCEGLGIYGTCPALKDAIAAKEQAPLVDKERAIKRAQWEDVNAKHAELMAQVQGSQAAHDALKKARAIVNGLRLSLSAATKEASSAGELMMARAASADCDTQIAAIDARLAEIKVEHATRLAEMQGEIEELQGRALASKLEDEETQAVIQREIDALPTPGAGQAVAAAKAAIAQAQQQAQSADDWIAAATAARGNHEAEIKTLQDGLIGSAVMRAEHDRIGEEVANWRLLADGLRGVIDLTIEDAGPAIADIANKLLTEAYGPRFSLRIVTQRVQQNGVTRECFDVSVVDAQTEIESSLLHKSGGESVWLDKALCDAVALYQQEAAGVGYECLFADEAEDGLTQERKAQFYQMDRETLRLGGYQRKFFISHNPDSWALADYVIDLAEHRQ